MSTLGIAKANGEMVSDEVGEKELGEAGKVGSGEIKRGPGIRLLSDYVQGPFRGTPLRS